MLGIGDPCAPSQTQTASRLPAGPIRRHRSNRPGKWAGASEPQVTFEDPLCQNPWAHAPTSQCPHISLPLCWPHNHQLRAVGLLGTNPKPRLAPKVPFPRGLVPQRWGLRTPEHQGQTYPAARPPPGPIGAPLLIQGGRMGKDL